LRARIPWGACGAALLAFLGAALTLRLWRANLSVPFRYSVVDDTKFYLSLIKGILDHGWYLNNPSLGAPFGQQFYDFPQGADNLNLLAIKGLGVLWPHAAVVINLFFLLTFPLTALAGYAVLRRLGVSTPSAVLCAVAFALLPYHFFRSDSHLLLSAYYSIPLGAYLFMRVVSGSDREPLFARRAAGGPRWLTWASRRTAWTVLICVVIASTGLYYAVFTFVVVLAGTLLALVARRGRASVAAGTLACALIAIVLAVNLEPTIVYQLEHGGNPVVTRSAGSGDELDLSLSYLILPPLHDRIAPLRHLTERYAATTPPHGYCEQCYESVGTVGSIGLLWLAVIALAACVGAPFALRRGGRYGAAAAGVAICAVVGATGGLSSLLRVFVTADIRAWNRLSVMIAFFSLIAVGLLLDEARAWLRARWWGAGAFALLVVALLALTVYEETSSTFAPPYAADAREYSSDARFVTAVEHRLPAGASVLELPYVPFPEGYQPFMSPGQTIPFSDAVDFEYEPVRDYVHSAHLRFSYGAMKGRSGDWESQLAAKPLVLAVAGAAAAGFQGAVIDPRGYPGSLAARMRTTLTRMLGVAPVLSPDRDRLFYDLRPYQRRMRALSTTAQRRALRKAVLYPIRTACTAGALTLTNPSATTRPATLTATVDAPRPFSLRLIVPGSPAARIVLHIERPTTALRVRLKVPPGVSRVALSAGGSGIAAQATVVAPTVIDRAFAPFAEPRLEALRTGVVGPPCAAVTPRFG
jgi:hypothetical protein